MPATQPLPAGRDRDDPGRRPAEIQPGQADFDRPDRTPAEIGPAGDDTDHPDSAPAEVPAQPIEQPDVALPPD